MTTATLTTIAIVDEIGFLEEEIKNKQAELESKKDELKLLGAGTYVGALFVTTVSNTPEKKSVSWAKAAKEVNIPASIVEKHTTVTYNILSATTKARAN